MSNDLKTQIDSLKFSKSEDERKKCIPLLQDFLSMNQEDAQAWYDLARCFDFIGDEVAAEPCYRKAYDIGYSNLPEKDRSSLFVGFGSTLRNNLKFSESREVLSSGANSFPGYPALDVFLAFTLYSEGKFKLASEHLFKAISQIEGKVFDGYENAIKWYADNLKTHPPRKLPQEIQTDRLVLRAITDLDIESIFEYACLPEVSKHTTWQCHQNLTDSQKLVDYAKTNYQRGLVEPLAISLKENPAKLIGTVGWF